MSRYSSSAGYGWYSCMYILYIYDNAAVELQQQTGSPIVCIECHMVDDDASYISYCWCTAVDIVQQYYVHTAEYYILV